MSCDVIGWTKAYIQTREFKTQIKKWLKVGRRKYFPWTCGCGCGGKIPIHNGHKYSVIPKILNQHKGRNMIGETHGLLYVYDYGGMRKGKRFWKCLCECSGLSEPTGSNLVAKTNSTKSCGCKKNPSGLDHSRFKDLTRKVYGFLTVIERDGHLGKEVAWLCRCDSPYHEKPIEKRMRTWILENGAQSCGCATHAPGPDSPMFIDIIGNIYKHTYTKLEVIKYIRMNGHNAVWEFECTSKFHKKSRRFKTTADGVKCGKIKSCGCLVSYLLANKGYIPNFNVEGCRIIDEYGSQNGYSFRHAMNGGEVNVLRYYIDGYDPVKNIVIEIYEPQHYRNGKLKKGDIRRQRRIMRYLGCTFIRIRVDRNNNIIGEPKIYKPDELPDIYPNHGIIAM